MIANSQAVWQNAMPVLVCSRSFVLVELGDEPLKHNEGELVVDVDFEFKEKKANYVARIPYAPKPTSRVIPSTVTFRTHEDGHVGRLVVIGFGPSELTMPTLMLEKRLDDGTWGSTNLEFKMDSFGFGKAVGRLVLPDSQTLFDSDPKAHLRLIDSRTNAVVVEFNGVLLK